MKDPVILGEGQYTLFKTKDFGGGKFTVNHSIIYFYFFPIHFS